MSVTGPITSVSGARNYLNYFNNFLGQKLTLCARYNISDSENATSGSLKIVWLAVKAKPITFALIFKITCFLVKMCPEVSQFCPFGVKLLHVN